jgi:hypothetical protein
MDSKKIICHSSRRSNKCPVFGYPRELPRNVLSTYGDVMKCYLNEKLKMKQQNEGREPCFTQISQIVAINLEAVWQSASIPTVSRTRIIQLIRKFHDEYRSLLKPFKRPQK